jgi:hypothetical protein
VSAQAAALDGGSGVCHDIPVYVLGHLRTVIDSGAFDESDVLGGDRSLVTMFPDLVSCHDWGYERSWDLVGAGPHAELVIAHMLGDAVVHYGRTFSGLHRKSGWAYLRMGLVARRYGEFFAVAESAGWREPGLPYDSRRGWAHTLIEYSIDQYLADQVGCEALWAAAQSVARSTALDLGWVHALIAEHVIRPSKPIESQPLRYCGGLIRATQPDEMHLRALALKFGLVEHDDCLEWLRAQLRDVWVTVGAEEMETVLASLRQVVADPLELGYPLHLHQTAVLEQATRWHLGDSMAKPSETVSAGPGTR